MLEMTLGPCGDRCYCLISHLYGSSRISWSLRIAPRWDPVAINDKTQVFSCFRSFGRGGLLFWGPYCLCCGIIALSLSAATIDWLTATGCGIVCLEWLEPEAAWPRNLRFFSKSEECTVALRLSSATLIRWDVMQLMLTLQKSQLCQSW